MKVKFFAIILLATSACIAAQKKPVIYDTSLLSVENLQQLIDDAEGSNTIIEIVYSIVQSERMDLIQSMVMNQRASYHLDRSLQKIDDDNLRDKIVMMMLKSESPYWQPDSGRDIGGIASRNALSEAFVVTITRNLPDLAIRSDLVATRASRLKLAGTLEVAIERRNETRPPPATERPDKQNAPQGDSTSAGDSLRFPDQPRNQPYDGTAIPPGQPEPARILAWVFVIGTVTVLTWVIVRKMKN